MVPRKRRVRSAPDISPVVKAAMSLFLSKGYEVSLDEIAIAAGVARQTLFNRFKSKEGLFRAVVGQMAGQFIEPISHFEIEGDVRGSLLNIARQYLSAVLAPQSVAINRLVVTQSADFPDLAKTLYDASTRVLLHDLEQYLARQTAAGVFAISDAPLISECFFGALHGMQFLRASFRLPPDPPKRIEKRCREVVDAFMKNYGTASTAA